MNKLLVLSKTLVYIIITLSLVFNSCNKEPTSDCGDIRNITLTIPDDYSWWNTSSIPDGYVAFRSGVLLENICPYEHLKIDALVTTLTSQNVKEIQIYVEWAMLYEKLFNLEVVETFTLTKWWNENEVGLQQFVDNTAYVYISLVLIFEDRGSYEENHRYANEELYKLPEIKVITYWPKPE